MAQSRLLSGLILAALAGAIALPVSSAQAQPRGGGWHGGGGAHWNGGRGGWGWRGGAFFRFYPPAIYYAPPRCIIIRRRLTILLRGITHRRLPITNLRHLQTDMRLATSKDPTTMRAMACWRARTQTTAARRMSRDSARVEVHAL